MSLAVLILLVAACDGPTHPSAPASERTDAHAAASSKPFAPYVIQDLGSPPGFANSFAIQGNNLGDIAVTAVDASGSGHAYRYASGWKALGTVPGTTPASDQQIQGINNRRAIVGFAILAQDTLEVSFIWTPEHGMRALAGLPGTHFTDAFAISDVDEIIGCALPGDSLPLHLVRWLSPGRVPEDLGTAPGGTSVCPAAGGINITGQVAASFFPNGVNALPQATLYDDGHFHAIPLLPGLPGSTLAGINIEGTVAGIAIGPAAGVPFIWGEGRGIEIIPFMPGDSASTISGLNDFTVVVGVSNASASATCPHPWVWAQGSKSPALLPGFDGFHPEANCTGSLFAQNLNDFGVVVGGGSAANGDLHTVRWTPRVK